MSVLIAPSVRERWMARAQLPSHPASTVPGGGESGRGESGRFGHGFEASTLAFGSQSVPGLGHTPEHFTVLRVASEREELPALLGLLPVFRGFPHAERLRPKRLTKGYQEGPRP